MYSLIHSYLWQGTAREGQNLTTMALLCGCPPATAITSPDIQACYEDIGQIQRLLFQRKYSSGTTLNSFTIASANPNVLASWTPLLAASDGTKVVQTPYVQSVEMTAGEPVTFGGGNDTLGGIETIVAVDPTTFNAMFHRRSQIEIDNMKSLMCEILSVYFIDEYGRIIGLADDNDSATTFRGFPVAEGTLFIGDKVFGGRTSPDMNALRFQLLPNWSDNLYVVTPTNFDPLDNLV